MMENHDSGRWPDRMRSSARSPDALAARGGCRRLQVAAGFAARLAVLVMIGGPILAAAPVEAAQSLWSASDVPAQITVSDTAAVELGVRFKSSVAGTVTGIRFYKGPRNLGTHKGSLWTTDGTRLATGTFLIESASGWQSLLFAAPVVIAANTVYVASYYAPEGQYSATNGYFASARTSGALTAPASSGTGNGVYRYGTSGFPNQTYQASNYWVDLLFEPSTAAPPPPPLTTSGPPAGYTLAWSDEFNSLSLGGPASGRKWSPYYTGWNVRRLAGNSDDAVKMADYESLTNGRSASDILRASGQWADRTGYLHEVAGGQLYLRGYPVPSGQKAAFSGFPYVASMITGQSSFSQRYGYWQTRVKLNTVSKGHHFAVWLLPTDNAWPPEIDMLEVVGQAPTMMFANSHGENPDRPMATRYVANNATDWHVLGFLWTPNTMRWTMNGVVVREHANYITSQNLYFLMTWEVASSWPGNPDASTRWPAEVAVDYVRIYRPSN